MSDAIIAFFVLVLLMLGAGFDMFVKAHLAERHRSRDTVELASLVGSRLTHILTSARSFRC